jgi:hypothetical protein
VRNTLNRLAAPEGTGKGFQPSAQEDAGMIVLALDSVTGSKDNPLLLCKNN